MACELEEAFDHVRSLLPDGWVLASMVQSGEGWRVSVGKWSGPIELNRNLWPRIDTKAGTLTKALNRMIDELGSRSAERS